MNDKEKSEILKEILKRVMGDNKTILKIEADARGKGSTDIEGTPITLVAAYSTLTHALFGSLQENGFSKADASQMMLRAYAEGISYEGDEEGDED